MCFSSIAIELNFATPQINKSYISNYIKSKNKVLYWHSENIPGKMVFLSYDVASESFIKPDIKYDNSLVD